jgi:16S rRNA (guanine966-N2)-methyltransferase
MRVIAGSAKGVRLAPVPRGVRPVSDRAREGLFSSVAPDVPGAEVLDLFAGTGALGIEALSRGADRVVFVERDRTARRVIAENLRRSRLAERGRFVGDRVLDFVMRDDKSEGPFDLVLADPPYDLAPEEIRGFLEGLARGWLAPGWTVVLTRPSGSSMPVIPVDWHASKHLRYGDTAVLIFREA